MNIYDYFRSPDIAAHCENIGHVFNPLEMAVIIAISKKTIKEKHSAWRGIISDYPDMPIHKSMNFGARDSLHTYLHELMIWEENWLSDFNTPVNGAVYRPITVCGRHDCNGYMGCFSTVVKAWAEIRESSGDWEEDNISHARIYKDIIDVDYDDEIWLNSDGEVFFYSGRFFSRPDDLDDLTFIFIHIPLPFEKGDIVEFVDAPRPCVLRNLPHWSPKWLAPYEKWISGKVGDGTDMIGWVWFIDEDGLLSFNDGPDFFYDLKYFTGELKRQERFLGYLSDYIKNDQTDIYALIYAFNKIKAQADAEDKNTLIDSNFRWWSENIDKSASKHIVNEGGYDK